MYAMVESVGPPWWDVSINREQNLDQDDIRSLRRQGRKTDRKKMKSKRRGCNGRKGIRVPVPRRPPDR